MSDDATDPTFPELHDTMLIDKMRVFYCLRVNVAIVIDWVEIESFPRIKPPPQPFKTLNAARIAVEGMVRDQLQAS